MSPFSEKVYQDLHKRVGKDYLRQRIMLQVEYAAKVFGQGRTFFHIENADWLMFAISNILKLTGLYQRGYKNHLDIQVVENEVFLSNLPNSFHGYRILQLSDLHLDFTSDITPVLLDTFKSQEYDLAVLTGDYRADTGGEYRLAMEESKKVVQALSSPKYGVLGNHDFIEFVPFLEEAGLPVLLNETVHLKRGSDTIYLSGVDDTHFYKTDDLHRSREIIPNGSFSILLSHSPELFRSAEQAGYDFMLSGHTHAGQICLPVRTILYGNARCPRKLWYGNWHYRTMQGFTSAGSGSSGVPVRFSCPPEIVIHTLRCAGAKAMK